MALAIAELIFKLNCNYCRRVEAHSSMNWNAIWCEWNWHCCGRLCIVATHKRCVRKPKGRNDNRTSLLMRWWTVGRSVVVEYWRRWTQKERQEKSAMDSLNGMNESLETTRENAVVCEIRRFQLIYWIIIMFVHGLLVTHDFADR